MSKEKITDKVLLVIDEEIKEIYSKIK